MAEPAWTTRTLGALPESWPLTHRWVGEWMTIDDETWFSRISPDGDPDVPPLVLVHGLVVSGSYFRPVARFLDANYRIYIPDLPGYGRSPSKRMWTVPSITQRLADWMDAHDLRDCVLVGNSLGCQIITLLATTRPDLVRGMVLVAPTLDPAVRNGIHLMLRGALDIPRERRTIWGVWIPDFLRAGPRRALMMLHQTMRDGDAQLDRLGDVHQPALVVGGGRDPISPPEWVQEMANRMLNARALILDGCPHALNYSSPRNLARAIDTVIQGNIDESR